MAKKKTPLEKLTAEVESIRDDLTDLGDRLTEAEEELQVLADAETDEDEEE